MRQRITFVHTPGRGVDPTALAITDATISTAELSAAREDRITASLDELPAGISRLLREACSELHVRWISPQSYDSVSPLSSRMSPGLHVFVTPAKSADEESLNALAASLRDAFGLVGMTEPSPVKSHFTSLPPWSPPAPASLQYHEPQESATAFASFLKSTICREDVSCASRADTLETAVSIDLSIDTTSAVAKLTALWPHASQALSVAAAPGHRTEVGILGVDPSAHKEEHELGLSGLVTVLGEHSKPSPVVFAIPARHREAGASFTSAFVEPAGLHPMLRLSVSSSRPPSSAAGNDDSCTLHAHFTFPKIIFADRYQLSDELFLASKNLTALRYASSPVDLEAPAYATSTWGSSVVLRLAPPPASEGDDGPWTAEVPLHLRYLRPTPEAYSDVEVPYPAVFWACDAPAGVRLENNPFERSALGYDALFDPQTVFWHVEPRPATGDRVMSPIRVPVLGSGDASWVRTGTAAAILLGFGWVVGTLLRTYLKTGYGRQTPQAEAGEKAKGEKKKQ